MKTLKSIFALIAILTLMTACSPETDVSEFQNNDEEVQNTIGGGGPTTDNDRGH